MTSDPWIDPYTRCTATARTGRRCRNYVPDNCADWSGYTLTDDDLAQLEQGRCHVHVRQRSAAVVSIFTRERLT